MGDQTMLWSIVLAVNVVAGAAPKTMIVSADCSDPALINGAKDFRDTAGRLLGASLMEPENVLDIVRPRPTRSLQDVERQVDSAKALFYGGQPDRAQELLERALLELERASPQSKPWPVTQQALVLLALVHKSAERPKEMAEAFRRLVRLDPSFKLDPDAHPPSAIAALDAVKKELARARKTALTVRVEAGPEAQVYVDGFPMGPTPLKVDVPPGTYRVSLSAPGMLSFPHRVEVPREAKVSIDLNFEGAVGQQAPLCLLSGAGDGTAIKLGQLVTADRLIVLRNSARQGEPPSFTGSLFELGSGQQSRTGTVRPEALSSLATFLVTGKDQPGVSSDPRPRAEPARADAPVAAAPPPPLEPAPQPVVEASPPGVGLAPSAPSYGGVVVSLTLIAAGGAAIAAGLVHFNSEEAKDARSRLAGITHPDGKLPLASLTVGVEAIALMRSIDETRALSFTLVGVGAGAAAAGLLGLWLFFPTKTTVSVAPSPGGGTVTLSGSY